MDDRALKMDVCANDCANDCENGCANNRNTDCAGDPLADFVSNLHRLHTTEPGAVRIRRNLRLGAGDAEAVAAWCRQRIQAAGDIVRSGKNWYVTIDDVRITVNARSYTIITAHRQKSAPS